MPLGRKSGHFIFFGKKRIDEDAEVHVAQGHSLNGDLVAKNPGDKKPSKNRGTIDKNHGNLRYPPPKLPPPRNKTLIRPY